MRAISAVDIALWDRNARSVGLPLWRYLGSYQTETVPAYASGGYYGDGGTDEVRREVEGHVAAGFDAVKLKIGGASPSADAARVRAAREILGPDGFLLLDANNAWRDVAHAVRALRPLVEFDPYLIEEPFGPEDIESHRRLAEALPLTIASGEIAGGRHAHRDLLERGGITVLQPDVAVCGGITEWRRIAAMAAGASVPVMTHSFHDINAHLIASVPNGRYVEYFPDASILPFRNLLDTQLVVRDGALVLPTGPGRAWASASTRRRWSGTARMRGPDVGWQTAPARCRSQVRNDRPRSGRRARLDAGRLETLRGPVLDGPDVAATGLSAWTLPDLCREVEMRWGVACHPSHMGKVVRRPGLSRQKVRPSHAKADPGLRERFAKGGCERPSTRRVPRIRASA